MSWYLRRQYAMSMNTHTAFQRLLSGIYPQLLALVCVIGPSSFYAQDNHYEGLSLGFRNAILSGAGISRWVDQTAVVNNAATMMNADNAGFTFSSTTGGLDLIRFRDALGNDIDIQADDAQLYPGLLAADLPVFRNRDKHRLGIAVFNRISDRTRFTQRVDQSLNIINDLEAPGNEAFIGQYVLDIELRETNAAMAWATRLNDRWSAGLTLMALLRTHRYRENAAVTLIADPGLQPAVDVVSAESDISLKMSPSMLQLRGSLAWKNGPWNAGFIFTLPSILVLSSGDMIAQISLNNVRADSLSPRRSYFASAYLEKQRPAFKYPLSCSVGLSRAFESGALVSASATWNGAISRYAIFDPGDTPFLQPPSADNLIFTQRFLEVWSSNRALLNGALSAEMPMTPSFSLLGGIRSDLHYAQIQDPRPPGFQLAKKIWNRYHLCAGAAIQKKRSNWIVGLQYTHGGSRSYPQPFNFDGVTDNQFLQGQRSRGTVVQRGLMGTVSFQFLVDPVKNQ